MGSFVVFALGLLWFFCESGGEDAEGPILRTFMKLVCTTPFHPCLSEAVDLRGAARKLLFVYVLNLLHC